MGRLLRRGTRGEYAILLHFMRNPTSRDGTLRFRPLILRDVGCEEEDEGATIFHGGPRLCCGGTSSSTNSSSDAAWVSTAYAWVSTAYSSSTNSSSDAA